MFAADRKVQTLCFMQPSLRLGEPNQSFSRGVLAKALCFAINQQFQDMLTISGMREIRRVEQTNVTTTVQTKSYLAYEQTIKELHI